MIRNVRRGVKMSAPEGCPARVYGVMVRCWETDTSMRPSAGEVEQELRGISGTLQSASMRLRGGHTNSEAEDDEECHL